MFSKKYLFSLVVLPLFFAVALPVLPFNCFPSRDGGVFKSVDRGENWNQKVVISKNQTIASSNVLTTIVDPKDSNILYIGTRGEGLYKSMDGGDLWYHVNDLANALGERANVYDVAIDPQNNSNIYVGTYQDRLGRLFRSSDAGRSWEEVYRVSRERYAIFAVEIDSYDPSVLYMGTAEGGFLKSIDFGKSWRVVKWFEDVITDIKVNPYDTRTVFVSTSRKGVFKTNDKGQNWQSLDSLKSFPREIEGMEILVMDNKNPNVLYIGSKVGLLKSADAGQSWQRVNIIIPPESVPIMAVALDPITSSHLYYSAGNVIYRSQDSGQTWTVNPIATSKNIKTITIDPQNPQVVYAGIGE